MSVHRSTGDAAAPAGRRRVAFGLSLRSVVAFLVLLTGLLLVGGWWSASWWCWPLWFVVGLAGGVIAGSGRHIWLVALAALLFYPIASWLGLPVLEPKSPVYWTLLTLIGALVVSAGFALGTLTAWRPGWRRRDPGHGEERTADRLDAATRPASGRLLAAALGLGALGLLAWTGYSGLIGSDEMVHPTGKWPHCETPASRFGWEYEAINYDIADDARLQSADRDMLDCATQGEPAGTEVLTTDGIPIAGWYIPAANGAGPGAPTMVIVPGWKSNKTEILKYAPPFHEDFNLVLVDLRNGGRSGETLTTWGYREAHDVRAMVDWLVRTKDPSWIGAMGNSMGAATLLAEARDDPRVRALILDSMHGSIAVSLADGLEAQEHLPGYPTAWAVAGTTSMRIGADLTSIDPERTIAEMGDRPILLIHGRMDVLDRPEHSAERNLAAAQAAGVPVALRYCDTGGHGKVIDACPEAWAAWTDAFLRPLVP